MMTKNGFRLAAAWFMGLQLVFAPAVSSLSSGDVQLVARAHAEPVPTPEPHPAAVVDPHPPQALPPDWGVAPEVAPDAAQGTQPEPPSDSIQGSARDCTVIRQAASHIDATMQKIQPLNDSFPTQDEGEAAVDADLRALNDIVALAAAGGAGVEGNYQKQNFDRFTETVSRVSALATDRRNQKLIQPAPAEWVAQLTRALDDWSRGYSRLKNSCFV